MKAKSKRRTLFLAVAAIAVAAGLLVYGQSWLGASGASGIRHVGPAEFSELLRSTPNAILVDVRTPGEYREGHLQNSRLLPLQSLADTAAAALPDRDAPLAVYCRSGNRSTVAVNILHQQGYTNVINLTGGIMAWQGSGLPVVR